MTDDIRIAPVDDVETLDIVDAISAVFGPRTADWYQWKHVENPAGPSLGWVALDADGVVGVRLFQQWALRAGDHRLRALRPVDTLTLPRARRRGVFRSLLSKALDHIESDESFDLIFNTPNANSRDGYAKSGWTLLPAVRHGWVLTSPGRGTDTQVALGALQPSSHARDQTISTEKTSAYLRWRYDGRAGHEYRFAADRSGPGHASIVYRLTSRRGATILVLLEWMGDESDVKHLIKRTARKERAAATLFATGSGATAPFRPQLRRGSSVVAVRPLGSIAIDSLDIASWRLTLGDLEDVL